ncbi:DUF839 domain-containing protein [Pedobacter sp. UBA4863]|uniref:DUF839 domain-containing protein n=1 Tax=Pedobacter sp. UBA4863 TaxID=1947060 RepID=UPI0025EA1976|nr:DUF839 domain-containing protein [Pedobacter sp. UBA4863]
MILKTLKTNKTFFFALATAGLFATTVHAQKATDKDYGKVVTLFGDGTPGNSNGPSKSDVKFNAPLDLAVDKSGNIYIAEDGSKGIRKISAKGEVSLFAGSSNKQRGLQDGKGSDARFISVLSLAIHPKTGEFYLADNNRIRKITPNGEVSTFAGNKDGKPGNTNGIPNETSFSYITGITIDKDGNIYTTERGNNAVRKYTAATGLFTTLAGGTSGYADGKGTDAQFKNPTNIVVDEQGNLFVTDRGNLRIRKITPDGTVTTFAGSPTPADVDGKGTDASFNDPFGITIKGTDLYVSGYNGRKIRKIDAEGNVTTIAGDGTFGLVDGVGTAAKFNQITGLAIGTDGNLYLTERVATLRMVFIGNEKKKGKK